MYDTIIETTAQQRIRDRIADAEQECAARRLGRRRTSRQDVAARLRKYGDRLDD